MKRVTHWRQRGAQVGIALAPDAVCLLQCGPDGALQHAHEPLPPGALAGSQIADSRAVGAAIARAVQRSGMHARRAVLALAAPMVSVRVLRLASGLSEAELETRLELEAARIQPAGNRPPCLDFSVQGAAADRAEGIKVLLAVADPEAVDRAEMAMKASGLSLAVVDLEALALARALCALTGQVLALEHALSLGLGSAELAGIEHPLARRLPARALAEHALAWLLAYGLALHGSVA